MASAVQVGVACGVVHELRGLQILHHSTELQPPLEHENLSRSINDLPKWLFEWTTGQVGNVAKKTGENYKIRMFYRLITDFYGKHQFFIMTETAFQKKFYCQARVAWGSNVAC